jgi:hypothetical protein
MLFLDGKGEKRRLSSFEMPSDFGTSMGHDATDDDVERAYEQLMAARAAVKSANDAHIALRGSWYGWAA